MDTLQLVLRLFAFCVTFFILLDFIIICTVKTWVGILGIFAAAILTVIVFVVLRRHTTEVCQTCGRKQHANLFAKKNGKKKTSINYINPDDSSYNPFMTIANALH
jgi:hypothetical protein